MFGFYFAKGDQEGWLAGAKGRKLLGHPGLGIDSRITHFQQSDKFGGRCLRGRRLSAAKMGAAGKTPYSWVRSL